MKRIVLGVLAHVDAGKTTLSEALLYRSGAIRRMGRVDHADAFLDTNLLERSRGITIYSKPAVFQTGDTSCTLLDTPGHVDFSAEMERCLQVLDYAVLVISGTDGVQSHTQTLWRLLARYRIPTFFFVNKMDLAGADRAALSTQLRQCFGDACVDFGPNRPKEALAEELALCSEALMTQVLEHGGAAQEAIADAVAVRQLFPCWYGSALQLSGVEALLDGIGRYTRGAAGTDAFGARVFKINTDEQGNRLTWLKVTGGALTVKAPLSGTDATGAVWEEKANQLRVYHGARFTCVETALPGTVCAVTGLSRTRPGEGLGAEPEAVLPLLEPVLSYQVVLPPETNPHTALEQLRLLEEEDPQLHVTWNAALGEIRVQLMGEVQLTVLQSLLAQRFGMEATFGEGGIVYRETIATPVEGVGHYEPLRHYAEVHLLLEPGPRGSGLRFASACREDALEKNWQHLIVTHLEEKRHRGVLTGSPITDLKLTLVAGRAHPKHTEGGDFRQATYRAVRQGLRSAQSVLLEPWYAYRLTVPTECLGRAMADLTRLHATFSSPEATGDFCLLTGRAPVSCLRGYARETAAYTHGKGSLSCVPDGYEVCHNAEEVIAAIGYDADADTANPADSIFCSHGAGVLVKWNEAPAHMHLASNVFPPDVPDDGAQSARSAAAQQAARTRRAANYCAALAQDQELLQIFERTYGPLKKDPRNAFRAQTHPPRPDSPKVQPLPEGPEYLLVDGYNILFAWDELKQLAQDNLDAARRRLIDILCNYQGYRRCEVILVFDAYRVKGNPGEIEHRHNITVVYTREAETADMYIEKVTHTLSPSHRVRVATSDGAEQLIILGHGALRVSAASFYEEVAQAEQDIRAFLTR